MPLDRLCYWGVLSSLGILPCAIVQGDMSFITSLPVTSIR